MGQTKVWVCKPWSERGGLTTKQMILHSKFQISNASKGFTLIELIIVLGIFSILVFFLAYISGYHFQTYDNENAELNITNDARTALDDVDNYVRQAHRILSTYTTYTTGNTTLIVQIPSIDSSGQIIDSTYDIVVFYRSGSNFIRQVFPNTSSSRSSATRNLAAGVTSLTFSYNNTDYTQSTQVTTSITIQQQAGTQTRSITVSSQSTLRNY